VQGYIQKMLGGLLDFGDFMPNFTFFVLGVRIHKLPVSKELLYSYDHGTRQF